MVGVMPALCPELGFLLDQMVLALPQPSIGLIPMVDLCMSLFGQKVECTENKVNLKTALVPSAQHPILRTNLTGSCKRYLFQQKKFFLLLCRRTRAPLGDDLTPPPGTAFTVQRSTATRRLLVGAGSRTRPFLTVGSPLKRRAPNQSPPNIQASQ